MQATGLRGLVPRRTDLTAMGRLALPIVAVQVGTMMMGVADTVMVGRVSATDLAAVGLGNLYFFMIAVFGMGTLMGLDPIVAQAVGAKDTEAIARGVQRGLVLSILMSAIASVLLLPAGPVLAALRQPAEVVPVAGGYARASIPGVLPFYAFVVLRQSLQAMGRVAPIVWTIVAANVLNLFLNWILIFGNLGSPRLGAVGSAWGSSAARWFLAVGLAALSWPRLRPYLSAVRPQVLAGAPLARMVFLGAPIGAQFQLEFGAFAVIGIMMGWLGTIAMAGHQVAINLASLTFMVPLGVAAASAVLVGHAVGRGDTVEARRLAGAGILLGGVFMLTTATAFLLLPAFWAGIYTADAGVLAVATALIPIAGIFQVFDGLQAVAAGVLRGAGDTRSPLLFNALGFWLLGMPVSVLLAFRAGLGPNGLWWGLATGLGGVALFLFIRVHVLLSRHVERVVIDDPGGIPQAALGSTTAPSLSLGTRESC